MPSIIDTLSVTDASKKQALPPHVAMRMKLCEAVDLQIAAATAIAAGQSFTKMVERFVTDPATGERSKSQVAGKFRRWWWTDPSGKTYLEIRYANRALELKPGKRAIEVTSETLIPTLERVKVAIAGAELDKALNAALAQRRKELKGSKPKAA